MHLYEEKAAQPSEYCQPPRFQQKQTEDERPKQLTQLNLMQVLGFRMLGLGFGVLEILGVWVWGFGFGLMSYPLYLGNPLVSVMF